MENEYSTIPRASSTANSGTTLEEQEQLHIFSSEELNTYEDASNGQRFVNWLIDNLFMRFAMSWATGYAVGWLLATFFPEFYVEMISNQDSNMYGILYLIGALNYIIYYTFCEKVFHGYTLGKLVSGTRAIRENGDELRFKDALLRSLCRLVPFEALSGFGYRTWHDKWTNTYVIKTR